jgi:hypothetical protein
MKPYIFGTLVGLLIVVAAFPFLVPPGKTAAQTYHDAVLELNNAFSGNNTHSGTEVFTNTVTIGSATGCAQVTSGVFSSTGSACSGAATITQVCHGAITLPNGTAMASGTKYGASSSAPQQTACTGMLTTDRVTLTLNADPTSTTGYAPSSNGGLEIIAYPDAGGGEIDLYLVNDTGGSITPASATVNYQVTR